MAYLEHAEAQMVTLQDLDAIQSLSPTLREEVAYRTMKNSISSFMLFEKAFGIKFVQELCLILKLEHFGPDDMICQQGHLMNEMFFVNSGRLKLFEAVQSDELNNSLGSKVENSQIRDAGQIDP